MNVFIIFYQADMIKKHNFMFEHKLHRNFADISQVLW